jgi:hypothetical protein
VHANKLQNEFGAAALALEVGPVTAVGHCG